MTRASSSWTLSSAPRSGTPPPTRRRRRPPPPPPPSATASIRGMFRLCPRHRPLRPRHTRLLMEKEDPPQQQQQHAYHGQYSLLTCFLCCVNCERMMHPGLYFIKLPAMCHFYICTYCTATVAWFPALSRGLLCYSVNELLCYCIV